MVRPLSAHPSGPSFVRCDGRPLGGRHVKGKHGADVVRQPFPVQPVFVLQGVKLQPGTGSSGCLTNGLRMRRKRGTFAKQRQPFVPQINVRITEEQLSWLSSEVRPFRNKSAVIRDLIDSRIQGLRPPLDYPRAVSGAGPQQGNLRPLTGNKPSLKQPEGESEALQEQQLPPHQTTAVPPSAQEPDHEKNIYKGVKTEIKVEKARKSRAKKTKGTPEFEAFWKRYQGCRHRANGQSKPKAMELWGQLVPDELQPDDLMRAIDGAIEDIRSSKASGSLPRRCLTAFVGCGMSATPSTSKTTPPRPPSPPCSSDETV